MGENKKEIFLIFLLDRLCRVGYLINMMRDTNKGAITMAKPKKNCPVCGSTSWNYDVVTMSCAIFCGDCYHEVKSKGIELGLMKYDCGFVFKTANDFWKAVKAAKQ
jgi:hypothetical protein